MLLFGSSFFLVMLLRLSHFFGCRALMQELVSRRKV